MIIDVITAWLILEVRDERGWLIERRSMPSRSPVRGFLEAILSQVIAAGVATVDTAGNVDTIGPAAATLLTATGPDNDDTVGIVVGTGVTEVSIIDDNLATKIAHGTGSGQLDYELQTMDSQVTTEAGYAYFDITRAFTNSSGATIRIFESAIYAHNGQGAADYVCIMRDVFTPLYVPNGKVATVKYRITIKL